MSSVHSAAPKLRSGLLPLILIGLAGCDRPPDPEPPPLTGEWTGEVVDFGDTGTVTFVLTEGEEGSLTGTMTLVQQGITNSGTTRGSYMHPDVVLNFELNWRDSLVRGSYTSRRVTYNRLEGLVRLEDGALAVLTLERRSSDRSATDDVLFPGSRLARAVRTGEERADHPRAVLVPPRSPWTESPRHPTTDVSTNSHEPRPGTRAVAILKRYGAGCRSTDGVS